MKKTVVVRPSNNYIYLTVLKGDEIDKNIIIPIESNSGLSNENMMEIRKALKEEGIKNCSAGTVIPDNKCIFKTIEVRRTDTDEIKRQLCLALNISADEVEEEYVYDYQKIDEEKGNYKLFCVVCSKSLIMDYKALFVRYGLKLDYLIPESIAIGNIIKNGDLEQENNIFVDFGNEHIVIRAYKGITCVAEHEIEVTGSEIKEHIGNIRLTLDYYDEKEITNSGNTGIYVYGEGVNEKNAISELKEGLQCSIYPVKSLFRGDISNSDASLIFPAMGSICIEGRRV